MTLSRLCAAIGRTSLNTVRIAGMSFVFLAESVSCAFVPPFRLTRVFDQIVFVGVRSLPIVALAGLFTGVVLGLQGYHNFRTFGNDGLLGALVSLPVPTAVFDVVAILGGYVVGVLLLDVNEGAYWGGTMRSVGVGGIVWGACASPLSSGLPWHGSAHSRVTGRKPPRKGYDHAVLGRNNVQAF